MRDLGLLIALLAAITGIAFAIDPRLDLRVASMGRPAEEDPILFQCAAAAGVSSVSSTGTGVA